MTEFNTMTEESPENSEQNITPEESPKNSEQDITSEGSPKNSEQNITPEGSPENSEQDITPEGSPESIEQGETADGSSAADSTLTGDNSPDNKKAKCLKVTRIVIRTVLWVIVAFFAVIALLLAYDKFIRKSPVASIFGNSFLVIASPSMEPELSAGDLVVVKKQDSYKVGDVVTYFPDRESISVTHRIVRIEGELFYFRGDANPGEDPDPVREDQIVGKVVNCFPQGGIIIEWFRTTEGIIFLIVILAILVALAIIG